MWGNVQLSKHIIVVVNCFQFVNIHLWLRYGSGSFARDERKIHESTHLSTNKYYERSVFLTDLEKYTLYANRISSDFDVRTI